MDLQVKIRFLLLSLYCNKYNGCYYDITEPFTKNNLRLSQIEATEMMHTLEKDGLIKVISVGETHYAQITIDGVEFIEENSFFCDSTYVPRDRISPLEKELLREKLDELSEMLTQPDWSLYIPEEELGKEIEELKSLLHILGRKSWRQILRGKLLELSQNKLPADKLQELSALFEVQNYAVSSPLTGTKNTDLLGTPAHGF